VDRFAFVDDTAPLETAAGPADEGVAGAETRKSIAVLPFVNMSQDPNNEYFSDGLSEMLLHKLAQINSLRVAARTSSFAFKGQNVDIRTIGKELDVETIIEGSVQKSGDRLRIIAQLIDVSDGSHLWSKNFDRPEEDIFAIQDEIAMEVAAALEVTLLGEDVERLSEPNSGNLEAYDAYLKGLAAFNRNTVAGWEEAVRHYRRAIELEPGNALAHAGLATTYLFLFDWGRLSFEEARASAERELTTALALDPESDAAYTALGFLKQIGAELQASESAFEHALALNPSSAMAHQMFADMLLGSAGRPQEALEHIEAGIELDPLKISFSWTRILALSWLGREEEWKATLAVNLERHPDDPGVRWAAGLIAWQDGRKDDAIRWFRECAKRDPENPIWPSMIGTSLIQLGADREAESWIDLAERIAGGSYGLLRARFRLGRFQSEPLAMRESALGLASGELRQTYLEYLDFYQWLRWLQLEEPDLALTYYERIYPRLLQQTPGVNPFNYAAAISLAQLKVQLGKRDEAGRLLDAALAVAEKLPWRSTNPDTRAMVYTLQGYHERALAELRSIIDGLATFGWRHLEWEPVYEPLRSRPEFRALVDELKADPTLELQLARLREMEQNGELAVHPAAQF
jgi:adenylate cyclase